MGIRIHRRSILFLLCVVLLGSRALFAASSTNAPPPDTNSIPLPAVASQAESTSEDLQTALGVLAADKITPIVQQELPLVTSEISSRLGENASIVAGSPSLENLRALSRETATLRDQLAEWKRSLAKQATLFDTQLEHLSDLQLKWQNTRTAAAGPSTPRDVMARIDAVLSSIADIHQKVQDQLNLLLTLQDQVTEQDGRLSQSLASIEHTRETLLSHLGVRDSPPIWSQSLRTNSVHLLLDESAHSFSRQVRDVTNYVRRQQSRFLLQGIIFLALFGVFHWAGRALQTRAQKEPGLKPALLVFAIPGATALLLTLFASHWIYPQAPRLLWAVIGAATLIPATIVLRRFIDRHMFPLLNLLVVFYFVDQLRAVAASQEYLSRFLFLAEMLAASLFFACSGALPRWKVIFRVVCAAFAVAFLSNAVGYVGLSSLLGNTLLLSAYLALILYAIIRITDGLTAGAMGIPPLVRLGMVSRHQVFLQERTHQVLRWAAILLWVYFLLNLIAVRAPFQAELEKIWEAHLQLRSLNVTVGDVFLFVLTIAASFFVSRVLIFLLDEEVYPRIDLAPGLHYSISKVLHYIVLLTGFLIGLAWLGFNMSRLTILAGAFSVGLGFGLQNIVNNFVSGIILLFERPVKVGDVIVLDSGAGTVKHIGIRASIVRSANGSEIIVPNSSFISASVVNFTLSSSHLLVSIPVAVTPGPDATQIVELLKGIAAAHPMVLKDPLPRALFVSFTNGALNFELRAWTSPSEDWYQVRSDLCLAINAALTAQKAVIK
jgi:small-conductance mechanosensitive channel